MNPDFEHIINDLENAVYAASVKYFEGAEHAGLMVGNGHHAAQKLAKCAGDEMKRRAIVKKENSHE